MIKIFYCPQMATLAQELGRISHEFELGEISWRNFRDGFPDLKVLDAPSLRNKPVVFLASLEDPGEIFRQLSIIYELPRLGVKSLKVVLPYFPTGTKERVDEEGEIATAATLARMLSRVPGTMTGPAQILIYDIHALQERFYFSDQIIPRLETAIPLLLDRIGGMNDITVAFPDQGACKRFGRMFKGYPLVTAHKVREKDGRRVVIRDGEPRGRHVVIVDDLVMTGGTLIQCREVLMKAGAAKVSAFVTHGVFPDGAWKRFAADDFTHFWMTDSCPGTVSRIAGKKPFEVLSLVRDIAGRIIPDA
ncbi:ribose-phosphate diphosphokinase [Desulfonatronovibrio hydrogenovorans]|uniref:ribose-phosphate diphosphokinase n=1 Tax=Desulfonatronovibrio hydrogenovorans TaxID=53245 RepID=UPI001237844D|nr:ribose-phosphate diphosphokinase [Desulfonatronovibrio hydrogenovorans]